MAERAPELTPGQRIRLEHQRIDQSLVLSTAAQDLLKLPGELTYCELLQRIKKHSQIDYCDSEAFMAEARRCFFFCDPNEMLRQQATDRGRRCVEVAALLYYNAHPAYKGSWPCILRKFKSRIVVDVLLDETSIKSPVPIRNDWCGKRGLYLVDPSRKIDFADKNLVYVTKRKNISAIKKYEKRMRGQFLEMQPFASTEAHEFWKKKLSSQSDVDIASTLADIANRGGIQLVWWPDTYVPIHVYEKLGLNEEIDGHWRHLLRR
ncbi:hypothetical protein G3M48_003170 [Beauveria asiatica]|uniref:Uncharacterized protein n=1 Tax=Beauveria asiatica TaxID=1069075 RepID=A0AAW0RVM9_9HYPO